MHHDSQNNTTTNINKINTKLRINIGLLSRLKLPNIKGPRQIRNVNPITIDFNILSIDLNLI